MATSCSVIIKEGDYNVVLYHHCDGEPSNVGMSIHNFLRAIEDKWTAENIATRMVKGDIMTLDSSYDTNYEIIQTVFEDSSYVYEIDCNEQTLTMWEIPIDRYATKLFKEFSNIVTFETI